MAGAPPAGSLHPTRFSFVLRVHEIRPWLPELSPVVLAWQRGERRQGFSQLLHVEEDEDSFCLHVNEDFKVPATLYREALPSGQWSAFQRKTVALTVRSAAGGGPPLARALLDLADFGRAEGPLSLSLSLALCGGAAGEEGAEAVIDLTVDCTGKKVAPTYRVLAPPSNGEYGDLYGMHGNGQDQEDDVRPVAPLAVRDEDDAHTESSFTLDDSMEYMPWETPAGYSGPPSYEVSPTSSSSGFRDPSRGAMALRRDPSFQVPGDVHFQGTDEMERERERTLGRRLSVTLNDSDFEGGGSTSVDLSPNAQWGGEKWGRTPSWNPGGYEYSSSQPPPSVWESRTLQAERLRQVEDERRQLDAVMRHLQQAEEKVRIEREFLEEVKERIAEERAELEETTMLVAEALANAAAAEERARSAERACQRLPGELRDAALAELAVYSAVVSHGCSSQKLHTPARRIARAYWWVAGREGEERAGELARMAVRALMIAAKSSVDDVSRLVYWWSNAVVLREALNKGPSYVRRARSTQNVRVKEGSKNTVLHRSRSFPSEGEVENTRARGEGEVEGEEVAEKVSDALSTQQASHDKEETSTFLEFDGGSTEEGEDHEVGEGGKRHFQEESGAAAGRTEREGGVGEREDEREDVQPPIREDLSPNHHSLSDSFGNQFSTTTSITSSDSEAGDSEVGRSRVANPLMEATDGPQIFAASVRQLEEALHNKVLSLLWEKTFLPLLHKKGAGSVDVRDGKGMKSVKATRSSGPLGQRNIAQGLSAVERWRSALSEAARRLCPARAAGIICGCLPVLPRQVLEVCCARLDAALFNAALDAEGDPVDPRALPFPCGQLTSGHGLHLKMAVSTWSDALAEALDAPLSRPSPLPSHTPNNTKHPSWLPDTPDLFSMDLPSPSDMTPPMSQTDEGNTPYSEPFPYLRAMADLLILPKALLSDHSFRKEVCGPLSLHLVRKIIYLFAPDGAEAGRDYVSPALLATINAEVRVKSKSKTAGSQKDTMKAPLPDTSYVAPTSQAVRKMLRSLGEDGGGGGGGGWGGVMEDGEESDEDMKTLESCLDMLGSSSSFPATPSSNTEVNVKSEDSLRPSVVHKPQKLRRYTLLREMWGGSPCRRSASSPNILKLNLSE